MEVGDRHLGCRHEVQVVAGDDVHLVFLVRDLAGAPGRRRVDHGRRPDLGEAVLAGVDVEEPADQGALERRSEAAIDGKAGARDLGARARARRSQVGRHLPVRPALPGRPSGGASAPTSPLNGWTWAAARPRSGSSRSPLRRRPARRGRPGWGSAAAGPRRSPRPSPARRRSPRSARRPRSTGPCRPAVSGPFGSAPPRIASPIAFDAVFRSAFRRSPSASSSRRRASAARAASTIAGSSPLSIAPWRIGCRRHPGGAAGRRSCARLDGRSAGRREQAIVDEGRLEAGQQPARPRSVRAAQEGQVERGEGPPGGSAGVGRGREDQRLPGVAGRRRPAAAALRARAASQARCSGPSPPASAGSRVVAHGDPRLVRRERLQPGVGGGDPLARASPASAAVSGAPFSASIRASMSTPGIWRSRARWPKAGRNAAATAATSAADRAASSGRRSRGRPAARPAPRAGRRVGQPVEFVEQARDGVRAVGIELDRGLRPGAQEEQAELLRRHDLGRSRGRPRRGPSRSTSCGRRCSGTRRAR